ncbi:MAG: glucosamine-6-phosphate deaminase [Eubacteriaceae bacterium]|jgi:glucosamine-6-phosphate deaminase|nr:glucosamine-6-phosphate deaminase [Eubacteriaceae bacterium]
MELVVLENGREVSRYAARIVAQQLLINPKTVLGLATGSTPEGMYSKLVRIFNEDLITFEEATSFNLDEYVGLPKDHPQSYFRFMKENLLDHVNFKEGANHMPNGLAENLEEECVNYEKMITSHGGIDLQVLGIGRNAHIGFNEPGTEFVAETHVVDLTESTLDANARFFTSIEEVPKKAISMGIKTIMQARKILLLVIGGSKADALVKTLEGTITIDYPSSVLKLHPQLTVVADKAAAAKLKKIK